MKKPEFDERIARARLTGLQVTACELVLVWKSTAAEASRKTGCDQGLISRTIKRIRAVGLDRCDSCGRYLP